jgi:hypothetical protein
MLVLVVLFSALANHTSSAEATGWPSILCSLDLFELSACYPCRGIRQVCRPAVEEGITRWIGDGVCHSLGFPIVVKYGITRWIGDGSMPFAKGSHYGKIRHHTLDGRWKYAIHQGNGAYH